MKLANTRYFDLRPESLNPIVDNDLNLFMNPVYIKNIGNGYGTEIKPGEYGLLYHLLKNKDCIKSEDTLKNHLYGELDDYSEELENSQIIISYVYRARKALKAIHLEPNIIETVKHQGYVIRSIISQSTSALHSE